MEPAKLSRIEYEVKYSSIGKCPHCNEEINTNKSEMLLDRFGDREIGGKTYHYCLLNLGNIRETWFEEVKKNIPVVSETQCDTVCVLEGKCPYCGDNIIIRQMISYIRNNPPAPGPGYYKEIHCLKNCPECNNLIHISGGNFYDGGKCPDHIRYEPPKVAKRGIITKTTTKVITFLCPVCKGKQNVPASLYGTNTTSDNADVQCRSCQGRGYVFGE